MAGRVDTFPAGPYVHFGFFYGGHAYLARCSKLQGEGKQPERPHDLMRARPMTGQYAEGER
jgi:hypothetical protein